MFFLLFRIAISLYEKLKLEVVEMQNLQVYEIQNLSKFLRRKHSGSRLPLGASLIERFAVKVEVDAITKCWNWRAGLTYGGYGQFNQTSSHRFIYKYLFGAIPENYELDHLCRNRKCCNPEHLEAVTPLENIRRAAAAITHCPHGHAYDVANTYYTKRGYRSCIACQKGGRVYLNH